MGAQIQAWRAYIFSREAPVRAIERVPHRRVRVVAALRVRVRALPVVHDVLKDVLRLHRPRGSSTSPRPRAARALDRCAVIAKNERRRERASPPARSMGFRRQRLGASRGEKRSLFPFFKGETHPPFTDASGVSRSPRRSPDSAARVCSSKRLAVAPSRLIARLRVARASWRRSRSPRVLTEIYVAARGEKATLFPDRNGERSHSRFRPHFSRLNYRINKQIQVVWVFTTETTQTDNSPAFGKSDAFCDTTPSTAALLSPASERRQVRK